MQQQQQQQYQDQGAALQMGEDQQQMDQMQQQDMVEEEEGAAPLLEIERLTEHGISAADITKLKAAGIFTIPGIQMQCRKTLTEIKGLSEAKIDKVLEAARKLNTAGFLSGVQCMEQRKKVIKINTGSIALNQLLGGGLESASITEAFGEFRTGKTQLAHTLCVTAQLPLSMGGGNGRAIYVDTEATFRPERIKAIAERFQLDPAAALENVMVARAFTHEHQAMLLSEVAAMMAQDQYSLIVVDSITALFRVDFSGRGELAERQQKLGRMMSQLIKLAEEFNVAVYITNQVVADPGGASMFVSDPKKPIGGHILAHASTTRLSMRKGRGDQRIVKIYDSPSLPENECIFSITEQGIVDAKE